MTIDQAWDCLSEAQRRTIAGIAVSSVPLSVDKDDLSEVATLAWAQLHEFWRAAITDDAVAFAPLVRRVYSIPVAVPVPVPQGFEERMAQAWIKLAELAELLGYKLMMGGPHG